MTKARKVQSTAQGLWRRMKRAPRGAPRPAAGKHKGSLVFTLPSPFGGQPWLSLKMATAARRGTRGERMRIVAQMDTWLPELRWPSADDQRAAVETRDSGLARRLPVALRQPAARVLARFASKRLSTRIDVHGATLPLSDGATALGNRIVEGMGITASRDAPRRSADGGGDVQHWHGHFTGADGSKTRLTVLQASDLPLRSADTGERLNLAATLLTTVESDKDK